MIGNRVVETQLTKPAVSKMKLDFLTQLPFGADAVAIAYNQHPDQELRIDRRPTNVAVERRELLPHLEHYSRHHRIYTTQQVIRRDAPFEIEQIE
jgi:hypothetical protein